MRRLLSLAPALAVVACLAVLPACGKKAPPTPTPGPGPSGGDPTPGMPGGAVSSEFLVFAQVNAKDVFAGELFAEIMKAAGAGDAAKMKEKMEQDATKELGVNPLDIVSFTVCVTDVPVPGATRPPRKGGAMATRKDGGLVPVREPEEPKFVGILVAAKPIDKAAALRAVGGEVRLMPGKSGEPRPDARGFYHLPDAPGLVHFPDDKTAVMVHPNLADKYLAGFAKDRSGWPMSAELTGAAAGHAVYAQLQTDKLPSALKNGPEAQQMGPLLTAKSATLTLDLKGKTLALNARVAFPDAATANQAKNMVAPFLGLATMGVDALVNDKNSAELSAVLPAVKAAQKAVKEAKLETAGSDLTLAVSYTADFDIGAILIDAANKVKGAAERLKNTNNLKQIGIALHSIHDTTGSMPVHAIGKGGMALKNEKDKPLLSWRVAILPYIEQDQLYRQFKLDEPWDSETNKKLIDKMPKIFAPAPGKAAKPGHTHLQMVVGQTLAMSPVGKTLTGFTDGTSNTLAVVEAAESVVWTKPDDIMLPGKELPKDLKKKFGGQYPGGFHALMWSGEVRFVKDTVSDRSLGAALTPAAGDFPGKDW